MLRPGQDQPEAEPHTDEPAHIDARTQKQDQYIQQHQKTKKTLSGQITGSDLPNEENGQTHGQTDANYLNGQTNGQRNMDALNEFEADFGDSSMDSEDVYASVNRNRLDDVKDYVDREKLDTGVGVHHDLDTDVYRKDGVEHHKDRSHVHHKDRSHVHPFVDMHDGLCMRDTMQNGEDLNRRGDLNSIDNLKLNSSRDSNRVLNSVDDFNRRGNMNISGSLNRNEDLNRFGHSNRPGNLNAAEDLNGNEDLNRRDSEARPSSGESVFNALVRRYETHTPSQCIFISCLHMSTW
jgi:hypothetical protein